jgi:S-adenosylmethionine hydrolase
VRPLVTLTTDFGTRSGYVAQLKAVLYSVVPELRVIDITHDIPAQSVRHAEVVLRGTAFIFPVSTVHLVVVDPGVGTARRALAVRARGQYFVGPDNGVLGLALAAREAEAVVLDRPHLFREPVSPTFHGRDVFAPVAAELAGGLPLHEVGSPIDDALPSTLPAPRVHPDRVEGEVLAADTFGNLATNLPGSALRGHWRVEVQGRPALPVRTYADGPPAQLLALVGSDGYVEIALREGSAERELGSSSGLPVVCERA